MPKELESLLGPGGMPQQPGVGPDGKPIIDEEGGCMIQPNPGFVIKTKSQNYGKIFVNMCSHEMVDSFERKSVPQ